MLRPGIASFDQKRDLTLSQLHELAIDHALLQFDREPEVEVTWLIYHDPDLAFVLTPWQDQFQKEMMVGTMRRAIRNTGVEMYSFISEAYVSVQKAEEKEIKRPSSLPRNQRDEILMIHSFARLGEFRVSRFLITPRRTGKRILGPRDDESFSSQRGANSGMLWNLFEEERQELH